MITPPRARTCSSKSASPGCPLGGYFTLPAAPHNVVLPPIHPTVLPLSSQGGLADDVAEGPLLRIQRLLLCTWPRIGPVPLERLYKQDVTSGFDNLFISGLSWANDFYLPCYRKLKWLS